jgi:hypothetical protein
MLRKMYEAIGKLFVFTEEYRTIKRELYLMDNERKIQQEFAKKQVDSIISCQKEIGSLSEKVTEMQARERADAQLSTERKAKRTRKQA